MKTQEILDYNNFNLKKNLKRLPIIYAVIFSSISIIASLIIIPHSSRSDWKQFSFSVGTSSFICAYLFSYFLIYKKDKFKRKRLLIISSVVALVTHWFMWYQIIIYNYIDYHYLSERSMIEPPNPIEGILTACPMTLLSLLFFGWLAIPASMFSVIIAKKITESLNKKRFTTQK